MNAQQAPREMEGLPAGTYALKRHHECTSYYLTSFAEAPSDIWRRLRRETIDDLGELPLPAWQTMTSIIRWDEQHTTEPATPIGDERHRFTLTVWVKPDTERVVIQTVQLVESPEDAKAKEIIRRAAEALQAGEDEPRPPRGVVRFKAMPRDHAAEWDDEARRWRGPSPAFYVEVPLDSDEDRRLRHAYDRGTLTTVEGREAWLMGAEVDV